MALPGTVPKDPATVARTGVSLFCVPAGSQYDLEWQRAPDVSGSPGTYATVARQSVGPGNATGVRFLDPLPITGTVFWYRVRHVADFASASAYIGPVRARATLVPVTDGTDDIQSYREALGSFSGDGTLDTGVTQEGGTGAVALMKDYRRFLAQNTDPLSFNPPYAGPPNSRVSGAMTRSNTLGAVDQFEDKRLSNVSASGATVVALMRAPGAPTTQEVDFTAALLDAAGETEAVNLANAPASDDVYTVRWHPRIVLRSKYGGLVTGTLVVAIDIDDGLGGGFTERERRTYVHSTESTTDDAWTQEIAVPVSVSPLTANDDLRIRFVSFGVTGVHLTAVGELRGADGGATYTGRGVTYVTSTDSTVAATTASRRVLVETWAP